MLRDILGFNADIVCLQVGRQLWDGGYTVPLVAAAMVGCTLPFLNALAPQLACSLGCRNRHRSPAHNQGLCRPYFVQEVDEKMFSAYLEPQLGVEGESQGQEMAAGNSTSGWGAVCSAHLLPSPVPLVGPYAALRLHLTTAWPPFLLQDDYHWLCTLEPPSAGFQGLYTNKAGKAGLSVREGQATFFRTSRFQLAARKDLTLKHLFPAKAS